MIEERSASPDGRYMIGVESQEVRAFQWVDTPQLIDSTTGSVLLGLADTCWHLDSAQWLSDSVVVMRMRRFPDGLGSYEVRVDCGQQTAWVDGGEAEPLGRLEDVLSQAAQAKGGDVEGSAN